MRAKNFSRKLNKILGPGGFEGRVEATPVSATQRLFSVTRPISWKKLRLWSQGDLVQIPALPHTIWVTTGKSNNFFQPQFCHL